MPRKPDVPCSGGCGQLLWRGTGSLEQPTCRPCRGGSAIRACAYEPCGQEFRSRRLSGGVWTRFCSRSCFTATIRMYDEPRAASKANSRARRVRRQETWDGVTDGQVFERDGWICRIPGCSRGLIRRDLPWPDPLSPSIDHIVPLSLGGTDVAVNKRASHLICNISRGARLRDEDIPADLQALVLEPLPRKPVSRKPVSRNLPWPKVRYYRPCRWCGDWVRSGRPTDRPAVCGVCSNSGKCSRCGAKVMVTAYSRPPETRCCRRCGWLPAKRAELDERLWWTSVRGR